jgi:predicted TIM-barrel enzyme
MTQNFKRVFGGGKPVIGMVHLGALPGSPLYDPAGGIAALVDAAAKDLAALQAAGFDAGLVSKGRNRNSAHRA